MNASLLSTPARGQAWRRKADAECFYIMAHADGYVMARYKRCTPFVMATNDLQRNCLRMMDADRNMGKPVRFICGEMELNVEF